MFEAPVFARMPILPSTNPKDAVGQSKVPMHLWPESATIAGALAFKDGAKKYGPYNWRDNSVAASVYIAACRRHLAAWFDGEDNDPDSGAPNLGHALACLAIVLDAAAIGKLVDDRPTAGAVRRLLTEATKTP
jgi:hypothetical protein